MQQLTSNVQMMMLKVLSNTLETDILQKNICFYAGNKTRVLGM